MHEERFDQVVDDLSPQQKRAVLRAKDSKLSSWLNVLLIAKNHFDLSETEFRDALSIRYKKPLLLIPALPSTYPMLYLVEEAVW